MSEPASVFVAACAGKTAFQTFDAAAQVMRRIYAGERSRPGQGMKPYRCPACGHWHVGGGKRRKRT